MKIFRPIAFILGLGLGVFFFYGLWLTIRNIDRFKSPSVWIFWSAIFRVGITLFGFYYSAFLTGDGQFKRIILCLFGFLISRFIMTRYIHVKPKGISHVP